jgi:hypothetical protein
MTPDTRLSELSADDLSFFESRDNWAYGPVLNVVLSFRTLDEANTIAKRLIELLDVVAPLRHPFAPELTDGQCRGCVAVAPKGLSALIGLSYYTTDKWRLAGNRNSRAEIPPRVHLSIPPQHLARGCAIDTFWHGTEPTPESLALFRFLVGVARRAYAIQPYRYGHILDETWGFLGSPDHNPCIATYPRFAEAGGWPILGNDPDFHKHALISVT